MVTAFRLAAAGAHAIVREMSFLLASPIACAVTRLQLTAFRSHASLTLTVSSAQVVLTGPNGAGKTNILEAISFLSPGRGLRRAKLGEIDKIGQDAPWAVAAEITGPQGEVKLGTGRDAASGVIDKRILRVEGRTLRGQGELSRYLSILWLTPQMDALFLEGGTARRRFLDRLVYSFDTEHAGRVASYEHSLRERNRLLTAAHGHSRHEEAWLDAIERKLAEKAASIGVARMETVAHLNNAIQLAESGFPKAEISLQGEVEQALAEGRSALEAEEQLAHSLGEARPRDRISGRTGLGAHTTKITVTHAAKQMEAALCSTGEQKALLPSITLAQARAGALWHGTVPVLLLDEVVAHLDKQRRAELAGEIRQLKAQAWLTGTDAGDFSDWKEFAQFSSLG